MLIVSTGHPDLKITWTLMRNSTAQYVCAELIKECAAYYFEPMPDDMAKVATAPEHAPRVLQLVEHCE